MHINKISNVDFKEKLQCEDKHYLNKKAQNGIKQLLDMMDKESVFSKSITNTKDLKLKILSSIDIGDQIKFSDNRINIDQKNLGKKNTADCYLKIGKNRLYVNSRTGEIINYEIGFFTFWKDLLKKADKYVQDFITNFDNPNIVKKNTFDIIVQKTAKNFR